MVFLHVHKGCIRVCLAVAVPVTADMDVQIVAFQPFQPFFYGFNSLLQAGFAMAFLSDKIGISCVFPCVQFLSDLLSSLNCNRTRRGNPGVGDLQQFGPFFCDPFAELGLPPSDGGLPYKGVPIRVGLYCPRSLKSWFTLCFQWFSRNSEKSGVFGKNRTTLENAAFYQDTPENSDC